MKIFRFFVLLVVAAIFVGYMAGCSKPPTKEIAQAEKALEEAKAKEADLYVPDLFSQAEAYLKVAKEFVAKKMYKEAKEEALKAVDVANQSVGLVASNKKIMKGEAEKLAKEVEKSLDEFKIIAARAIKQKLFASKADMEGVIGKWELSIVNIKEFLKEEKVKEAWEELKAMNEKISEQKATVESELATKEKKKK